MGMSRNKKRIFDDHDRSRSPLSSFGSRPESSPMRNFRNVSPAPSPKFSQPSTSFPQSPFIQ